MSVLQRYILKFNPCCLSSLLRNRSLSRGSQVKIVLHVIFLIPNLTKISFFIGREERKQGQGLTEKRRHKLLEDGIGSWRLRLESCLQWECMSVDKQKLLELKGLSHRFRREFGSPHHSRRSPPHFFCFEPSVYIICTCYSRKRMQKHKQSVFCIWPLKSREAEL